MLSRFGVNKSREIERLLCEIKHISGLKAQLDPKWNFEKTKKYLLSIRYPKTYGKVPLESYYLPKLNIGQKENLCPSLFNPKEIFIDKSIENAAIVQNAKKLFPSASVTILENKKFVGSNEYSKRTETLYISEEKYDFVKACPCTKGAMCCGYNLVNLGFGCAFECEYCFLQEYQNLNAVCLPANIEDFLSKIDLAPLRKGPFDTVRIGSGEFTDSLIFDHITEYSKQIVPFFKSRPHMTFEFKTKSVNIDNLLKIESAPNVCVAWSVNADNIIALYEHHTPSLDVRLKAAAEIVKAGYKTAFHFDPVIIHDGWQKNYEAAIEKIAAAVPADSVLWISVGTLRFNRELKKTHEGRFPNSHMLDGEFLLGYDGKLRYSDEERASVYKHIIPLLQKRFPKALVYTCMENISYNTYK